MIDKSEESYDKQPQDSSQENETSFMEVRQHLNTQSKLQFLPELVKSETLFSIIDNNAYIF